MEELYFFVSSTWSGPNSFSSLVVIVKERMALWSYIAQLVRFENISNTKKRISPKNETRTNFLRFF